MKVFLTILFLVNGEPTILDGFEPREQPSMEICLERERYVRIYLNSVPNLKVHSISCLQES